jgi:hypothetical protein
VGQFDSSLTRVQPVFDQLWEGDPSGATWLPALLRATAHADRVPGPLLADPGTLTAKPEFEHRIAPPDAFLAWLLRHPHQLTWPSGRDGRLRYGDAAQRFRERLIDGVGTPDGKKAQAEGLSKLQARGGVGSSHAAWAFEGFTHVDAYLETDELVLLVEGKRTEALSPSTHWYPDRSQLARNLEAAGAAAGADRHGYVLLALENPIPDPDGDMLRTSLPHLSAAEQDEVLGRFLGQATWKSICKATGIDYASLPDRVEE